MSPSYAVIRRALRPVVVALVAAWTVVGLAADRAFDAVLGDEIEAQIGVAEVYAYRLPLVAGTSLDLRLESEASEDGGDPAKSSGPTPALALLDPSGSLVVEDATEAPRIRTTAAVSGTYVVEVRAGSFSGKVSLRLEGEIPTSVDDRIVLDGGEGRVTLTAPLGASVRVEVRRRAGDMPEVVAIEDGAGRAVGFNVKRTSKSRVRTRPVPVTSPGGLVVIVQGNGTYDVRGKIADDGDDLPEGDDDRESRRIVLTLAPGTDAAALADQLGYTLVRVEDGYAVLETPEGREGREHEDARDAHDRFPQVLGAEADARLQTPEGTQSNGVILGSSLERPDVEQQAALTVIHMARAHKKATGRGVVVAVLDTGVDVTHPMLADRLLPGRDLVDDDDDPSEETNGVDDDGDGEIDEGYGHGTFVAGLVLAVAPDARILPVRVLDTDAVGSVSRVAAGISYAVDHGADVINLSLGARVRSDVLRGEVRRAQSLGAVVVAATGNRADPAQIDFPAGLTDVVAVSALDAAGGRAGFANAGSRTTVAAPGTDLIGPYPGGEYATWSGTSFSAALVSGGLALLEERRPSLLVGQVVKRVRRTGRGVPSGVPAARRRGLGGGVLDLSRLVR